MTNTWTPKKRAESLMAAIICTIGLGGMIGGWDYGPLTDKGLVGPGLIPMVSGALSFVTGICILIKSIFTMPSRSKDTEDLSAPDQMEDEMNQLYPSPNEDRLDEFGRTSTERRHAVIWIFIVMGASIILANIVGLLLALTLMTGVLVGVIERKPWWVMLFCMLGTFLMGYLIFQTMLDVPMPRGYLGLV
ncbi:MAG: tripartite tricarboxylate transporter TctB family protein [Lautropia sp.]|nr:tripartite tricarboxylate transporter TctB family protein [Lautropia sp.]